MESFSVTLTKIKFSRLTSKLIKVTLLIFGISIALIQGVLFMSLAIELKAFFFESLGLLPSLLIVGIASFLVTNFLVMRSGTKKFDGLLKIGEQFNFESENKKLKLSYNFSDILTIKLIQYENDT